MSSLNLSQTPHAERIEDVPRYLWSSKEWTDIIVACNGGEIEAHRAILCSRSKFFDACLRAGLMETATGRVTLTEGFHIVEGILQYLYGVDITLLRPADLDKEQSHEEIHRNLFNLVRLYAAGDKYGIAELQGQVAKAFYAGFQSIEDPGTIINTAAYVYSETPFFDVGLRSAVITHVQAHLDTILSSEETSKSLLENQELSIDILRRVAPVLREQSEALNSGQSSAQTSPTTPKKRKSPRVPGYTPGQYNFRLRLS